MNLLVAGRITGSVLIICAYFVILHVSTFYGAIMHIIADIICIPFYVQNKQWDVAIMLAFLITNNMLFLGTFLIASMAWYVNHATPLMCSDCGSLILQYHWY